MEQSKAAANVNYNKRTPKWKSLEGKPFYAHASDRENKESNTNSIQISNWIFFAF